MLSKLTPFSGLFNVERIMNGNFIISPLKYSLPYCCSLFYYSLCYRNLLRWIKFLTEDFLALSSLIIAFFLLISSFNCVMFSLYLINSSLTSSFILPVSSTWNFTPGSYFTLYQFMPQLLSRCEELCLQLSEHWAHRILFVSRSSHPYSNKAYKQNTFFLSDGIFPSLISSWIRSSATSL